MKIVTSYKRYALRVTRYILTVLLFISFGILYGQTSTREEPVSLTREIPALKINEQTQKIMPFLDMQKIEQEDAEDNLNGIPPRFGYPHETNFTLENSGEWIELPDGNKIWRLQIYCPNATSINLLYDRFWLPEGAKFFIYSNDYREYLGAFTSKNNRGERNDMRGFSTGFIRGENITLEYYVPKEADDMGIISVSEIVHGYRVLCTTEWGFNCSNEFHLNAICDPSFYNEKDAVVLIVADGNRYCTGSLLNTTANNTHNKYFILTSEEYVSFNNQLITNWGFYWHYESPQCKYGSSNQPPEQPPLIYTHGASVVASKKTGNYALLELDGDPGLEWDVTPYYLGWNRSERIPTGKNTIIHHPMGDIKKIVSSTTPVVNSFLHYGAWETEAGFYDFQSPRVPELCSGGAPVFNSDRKVIGHYWKSTPASSCGPGGCKWYDVVFGQFFWAWDNEYATNSSERLRDWLDPLNTEAITCEGRRACQETIKLHLSYPKSSYHAVENIISKQEIPNKATTSYKAGAEIELIEGFHAKAGSTFSATIEENTECINPPQYISFSPKGKEQHLENSTENPNILKTSPLFTLYPNPNLGTFQLETNFPLSHISNLKITNSLGAPVYEAKQLVSNEIQLPNASAGLHFVVMVLVDGTILTQKMVIQR